MPGILSYQVIFYILFFLILGLGVLFGFMKGLKKSLYGFFVKLIFFVIFFLTVDLLANKLWGMNLPFLGSLLGNFVPEVSDASSLKEAMPSILNVYLGDSLESSLLNEEFIVFITSISLLIIKIVYAVLYFTVFNLIYKLICLIIRTITLRTKKDGKEAKRRGLGAACGLLSGMVTLYFVLIILGGTISVAGSAQKLLPDEYKIETIEQVVDAYNQNVVVSTANLIAVEDETSNEKIALTDYLFDSVFSFKYRKKQVSLRKELMVAADVNDIYKESTYKETDDLSDITGEEVREVFIVLSDSDLFTAVLPLGIETASDYLDTEVTFPKEELYAIDWETEMMQLGEVAAVSFDLVNAAGLIDEDVDIETRTINGDHVRSLFNSLSESKLVTLAAYEALEPILAEAGSDVEAIITVPEDLVWEDEFKAMGLVAGEIVDTGITVGDLKSGDPSQLITSLSQLDFTVILDSDIISNALINVISGKGDMEGFDVFVVPDDIVWIDVCDDEGNIIENGELRNILLAVNEISQNASNIDFDNLDMNVIADFSDESIDAIFDSRVLVATVSTKILEMELGNTPLLIADSVFDDNDYIYKTELTALVKSARLVVTTLVCDEGDSCEETGFDLSKAFDLSNENIDTLLSSKIIEATIGNLIIDQGGEVLTIPNKALSQIYVEEVEKNIVSKEEIKKVFKAVSALGFTDLENMTFDASILQNLATAPDSKVLDQTKADNLFNSDIIHATLSTMLFDLTTGESKVLVVPYKDVDNAVIRYMDEIEYVSTDELNAVLESVLVLDIADFAEVDTLDLNLIIDNIDTLLESAILHATISDQLFSLGEETVTIPYVDEEENLIRKKVGEVTQETEFIVKDELNNILDALELLGMTDINNFSGDIDLGILYDDNNQDILLASSVMQATISKQILDLGPSTLSVPYKDSNDIAVRKTVGAVGQETEYVVKNEIKAIIESLEILGIADINNFSGTVNLDNFYEETNQNILLTSASLHATVSKQILDLGSGILSVPYLDSTDNTIRVTIGIVGQETEYVVKDEIKAIIEGLEILEIDDINNFAGTIDLTKFYEVDTRNTLLASASLHATVSKQLFDLGTGTLVIPQQDVDGIDIRLLKGLPGEQTEYIIKNEIHAVFEALEILNIGEIGSFTGTVSLVNLYNEPNQDIMLTSASMHATISKQMNDLGPGTLLIPDKDIEDNDVHVTVSSTDYIYKTEIKALINALEVLEINDITTFSGGFNLNKLSDENKQTTLLTSASIHATISKKLFDLNDDVLIVPMYSQAGEVEVNRIQKEVSLTNFVVKNEIKSIINAFLAMNYTDLDSFGGSIDSSKFFSQRDTLLLSSSIQATLSNKMLNGTGGKLVVPNQNINNAELIRIVLSDVTYIEVNEMKSILTALELLNLTDFTAIDMNPANVFNVDFDTLLQSASVQATLSDNILDNALDDSAAPGSGTLLVPHYFREAIVVGLSSETQIEKVELKAILTSLQTLDVSDFGGAMNASTITSMSDAELTTMLESGSTHATFDNMLKGNANINTKIPDLAKEDVYNMLGITTKTEIKAFIKAANTLAVGNFTTVSFNVAAIAGLTPAQRDVVLDSMIVRNCLTGELEPIIDADPFFSVDSTYYENNDETTFFTKPGIILVLTHYGHI
ncbi:hypothetical protein KHQ81_01285 [Mycoplasmatota bacterium]|nr:hypothetical protein KHQ81_01285 [Mycoplasmatota bacterium]